MASKDKKFAPFVLLALLFVGGASAMGVYYATRPSTPPIVDTSRARPQSDGVGGIGAEGSPDYNRQLTEFSRARGAQAEAEGRSTVTPIIPTTTPADRPSIETKPEAKPENAPPPSPGLSAARSTRYQPEGPSQAEKDLRLRRLDQAKALMDRWSKPTMQQVAVYAQATMSQPAQPGSATTVPTPAGTSQVDKDLRPGQVLYALNELNLNSDAPGPVLCTVISGPRKGSKLLGEFQRKDEGLVLSFSRLLLKDGTEFKLKAFGIDSSTEVGLQSDVDHHYLERWGGLAAAAFLEGLANAKSSSNSVTVNTYAGGGATSLTQNPQYSAADQAWIAAGKVGEKLSDKLAQNFDRPPTVTLESGTPLGVLIIEIQKS